MYGKEAEDIRLLCEDLVVIRDLSLYLKGKRITIKRNNLPSYVIGGQHGNCLNTKNYREYEYTHEYDCSFYVLKYEKHFQHFPLQL